MTNKSNLQCLRAALITSLLLTANLSYADAYQFRVAAKGVKPVPVLAPPVSQVGNGASSAGGCASGAATGCAAGFTASPGTTGGIVSFFGPTSKATGKWYWEVAVTRASTLLVGMIGVAAASPGNGNYIGNTTYGVDYFGYNGGYHLAGNGGTATATFTAGDTIGVALDQTARTISFYKNCALQKTLPLPGGAAALFPGYSGYTGSAGQTDSVTFNFGVNNFTCPVPSGYNAGWW